MTMTVWPHVERTVASTESAFANGAKSVVVVGPTGCGKTEIGARLESGRTMLWVAHREELIDQAAERLRLSLGTGNVGIIKAGVHPTPSARVQVASVQTLLARGTCPKAHRLVLDECHHYVADMWRAVATMSGADQTVGLTPTPERADGRPLGDIFQLLIVAALYSKLIRDGILVPARVWAPDNWLSSDIAQDPAEAYRRYGEGARAFIFVNSVERAYAVAKRLRHQGVRADTIEANTAGKLRVSAMQRFVAGRLDVLTNVFTLGEGVNVPPARVVVLGRAFDHPGTMINACGRVLRSAPGKTDAIIIDLSGCTNKHGMPFEDREYSLTGRAISSSGREHAPPSARTPSEQEILGLELVLKSRGALPRGAKIVVPPPPPPQDSATRAANEQRATAMEMFQFRGKRGAIKPSRDVVRDMLESHFKLPADEPDGDALAEEIK